MQYQKNRNDLSMKIAALESAAMYKQALPYAEDLLKLEEDGGPYGQTKLGAFRNMGPTLNSVARINYKAGNLESFGAHLKVPLSFTAFCTHMMSSSAELSLTTTSGFVIHPTKHGVISFHIFFSECSIWSTFLLFVLQCWRYLKVTHF